VVGDPGPVVNGKRGNAALAGGAWTWDADRGAFVQDAKGWNNGRLFSYLSIGTALQQAGDDWLAASPGEAVAEAETTGWSSRRPHRRAGRSR
jgi:hypothetical protein